MRLTRSPAKRLFLVLAASLLATSVHARMEPLDDAELSNVTGQAFINLTTDAAGAVNYTRVNFGVKVDTQLNIKKLELGGYSRPGESKSSDILINNFALGTVGPNDTINPFQIVDPYFELAYEGNKVVGVRIGFAEAKGVLSGDISHLTGKVAVDLEGKAKPLLDSANFFQKLLLGATVNDNSIIKSEAELVSNGTPDSVRATQAGLKDGAVVQCISNCNLLGGLLTAFPSSGCQIIGITTCFNLSQFKSLDIGNTAAAGMDQAARGVFISVQLKDTQWRDLDTNALVTAVAGAFLNIPKYKNANGDMVAGIKFDFEQALNGIPRKDTCLGSATSGC
ncbi:DUF6160 family protein [Pseudomonas tohonis]|uniref:DUF6160 family protein n=1 Tax=Pseudomonas tohonis TaxID=2725477 RepID=UPI001F3C63E2|nr:DUF6160 family protein [Pseudomonas tohonis]